MRSNFKTSEQGTADQGRQSFIEAARRAQIIDCAAEAIAELGFAQASLAQIAKRAGVSTGVISYYFAGKDDLIRAVAAHVFATGEALMRPRIQNQPDAATTLRVFIEASLAFIKAKPSYPLAILNIIRAGRTEGGAPRYDPSIELPRRDGFVEILEWGQRDGEFRPFSVPVMVTTIIEAIDAVPQQQVVEPDLDLDAYAAELVSLFDHATRNAPITGASVTGD